MIKKKTNFGVQIFKELRTLKLQNCHWVTHGSIETLSYHQSKLEEVDLTSCWDLGDTAIVALLEKFRKYNFCNKI